MIIHIYKGAFLLGASVLMTVITQADSYSSNKNHRVLSPNKIYTAHGKIDNKSALIIKNLLKTSNPDIETTITKHIARSANKQMFTYTVKGTTSRSNALRLKQLIQNSNRITISMQASKKTHHFSNINKQLKTKFKTYFPEFTPFYYKGIPPIYSKGNVLWLPIRIKERQLASENIAIYSRILASNK